MSIVDVVAIDGPGGSGKSTVARAVARARGMAHLDTGAMYWAATWAPTFVSVLWKAGRQCMNRTCGLPVAASSSALTW